MNATDPAVLYGRGYWANRKLFSALSQLIKLALVLTALPLGLSGRGSCTLTAAGFFRASAPRGGGYGYKLTAAPHAFDIAGQEDGQTLIRFGAAAYHVTESVGSVRITVERGGDVSGTSTVDFVTDGASASSDCSKFDGLAAPRCDFNTAIGTLKFTPGETAKTFDVLINRDSRVEAPSETFDVALSNPTGGAALGTPSRATVVIGDVSGGLPPDFNVIDDTNTFVRQHYHDFLNREADAAGLGFWADNIGSCDVPGRNPTGLPAAQCREVMRVRVSSAFLLSIEFRETGSVVIRANKAAFGNRKGVPRYPDFVRDRRSINDGVGVGAPGWEQRLAEHKQAYLADLAARPDFIAQFPELQPAAGYVDKLFENAGVAPSQAEREAAVAAYGAGDAAGRGAALLSVIESGSVYNAHYNPAFVLMQYFGYLGRDPEATPDADFSGYDFWLAKMNGFSLPGEDMRNDTQAMMRAERAEMVRAFVESLEYRQRFGP